ncbi:MAG: endo alpha-1,4 polygalactosaminidase [Candidatus Schekmanbacteria bacterium]|nr:endo alpha-1,4 polygalactosaminidase [Candidatus Schekmanbacteria bacterium]
MATIAAPQRWSADGPTQQVVVAIAGRDRPGITAAAWVGLLFAAIVPPCVPAPAAVAAAPALTSWGYQLNGLGGSALAQLDASLYGLLVIDYSTEGDAASELTPAQVAMLTDSACGRRQVLAYMSIGEAEDYRFYWDPAWVDQGNGDPDRPAWLTAANPDWPGNYKVRYWMPEWQQIIMGDPGTYGPSYLSRLLGQGFDGVYLDIIDAYEYFGPDGNGENPNAAADMVALVHAIAAAGRAAHPGFLVFPQNGAGLGALFPDYVQMVDGIGVEDTFFDGDVAQPPEVVAAATENLNAFRDAGRLVLSIDYPTLAANVDAFYAQAAGEGYVPYVGPRELDSLLIHPGHEPQCETEPTATPTATPLATATASATLTPAAGPRQLTEVGAPASAQNPCWIGTDSLLYTVWPAGYNQGLAELWLVPLTGGNGTRLLGGDGTTNVNLPGACYSPRRDRIVFSREEGDGDEIWTLPSAGGAPARLLAEPGMNLIEPSWSPDGEWVAYERNDPGIDRSAIWKVRFDGTQATALTDGSGDDREPNWSPGGDRLVFQSQRTGDWEIWTMTAAGGALVNISSEAVAEDTDPAYSPSGASIVFSSDRGGLDQAKLFAVGALGGAPERVTDASGTEYEGAPAWSPESGAWIAYESAAGDPDAGRTQLWVAPAPGSAPVPAAGWLALGAAAVPVLVKRRVGPRPRS